MKPSSRWADAYPELVNKFRWAISTTFGTAESRYPFQDSQTIATVFSQEVLDLVKLAEEVPGVLYSTDTVRSYFQQQRMKVTLDKLDDPD